MNNIISINTYGILGLLPNSNQKELAKRLKDIEKLIAIDNIPSYDFDFGFYEKQRSIEKIKKSNSDFQKRKAIHSFFRISCDGFENKMKHLEQNFTYMNIVDFLNSNQSFVYKHNTAILLSIYFFLNNASMDEIKFLMNLWKEIIENQKYLKDFEKQYLFYNENEVGSEIFAQFKDQLLKEIVTIFMDIFNVFKNDAIIGHLLSMFDLEHTNIKIPQIESIYQQIDKEIEILDSMDISADGLFDDEEAKTIQGCLANITSSFDKLKNLALYESSNSKILRDRVVEALRKHSVDLHNNLNKKEICLDLIQTSLKIVASSGLKEKVENELQSVRGNLIYDEINQLSNKIINISYESLESELNSIKTKVKKYNIHENDDLALYLCNRLIANLIDVNGIKQGIVPNLKELRKALLIIKYAKQIASSYSAIDIIKKTDEAINVMHSRQENEKTESNITLGIIIVPTVIGAIIGAFNGGMGGFFGGAFVGFCIGLYLLSNIRRY